MIEFIVEVFYKGKRFTIVTFNDYDSMNKYVDDMNQRMFIDEDEYGKSFWSYEIYKCEVFI